jgi:hypothetical protein
MREEILSFADYYQRDYRDLMDEYLAPGHLMIDPVPDAFIINSSFSEQMVLSDIRKTEFMVLRIINAGVLSSCRFSVDGLPLTVLEIDSTPVEPFTVSDILLFTAQRVTLLLNWSMLDTSLQEENAIWFRFAANVNSAWPQDHYVGSGSNQSLNLLWKGTISFSTKTVVRPTYIDKWVPDLSARYPSLKDMNGLQLIPFSKMSISESVLAEDSEIYRVSISNSITVDKTTNEVKAYLNDGTFPLHHLAPTVVPGPDAQLPLLYSALGYKLLPPDHGKELLDAERIHNNDNLIKYPATRIIEGSGDTPFHIPFNKVIELTIYGSCCDHHPFHMHGHSFTITNSSEIYDWKRNGNNLEYPLTDDRQIPIWVERDVVTVPAKGWLTVRFRSTNPGLWLFHCHVHSHMDAGMISLFVEGEEHFADMVIPDSSWRVCGVEEHQNPI